MEELSSRERLIRTIQGKKIDRIATYDIIHNIDLIEYTTGKKVTPDNFEDLLCKTACKYLDLIRHFSVPYYEGNKTVTYEDGFVYRYEWWTGHVIKRPGFKTVDDVAKMVEKDIEKIYKCIEQKKVCHVANQHVNLFYEKFEYFEEIKEEYKRISEKLNGTVMMGPEMVQGIAVACERYDYK